jgi:hypothetical protein
VENAMIVDVALLVDSEDGRMSPKASDRPRQGIASRHAPPHPDQAWPCLSHKTRHHRLGDAKLPLDLSPTQNTASQDIEESIHAPH